MTFIDTGNQSFYKTQWIAEMVTWAVRLQTWSLRVVTHSRSADIQNGCGWLWVALKMQAQVP